MTKHPDLESFSELQKEFVLAIEEIGFKHKYFNTYHSDIYGDIIATNINSVTDIANLFIEIGSRKIKNDLKRLLDIRL